MGKYLKDRYLDSILENYFNEYNDYDNYADPEVCEQVKNYFKNPKYMDFIKKINDQDSISKLYIPSVQCINESKKIVISIGEARICNSRESIDFWNSIKKIRNYDERKELIKEYFSDIDKKYNNFIIKLKSDYNIIKIKIKKIFNFEMVKLDLSLVNKGYKIIKKCLKDIDKYIESEYLQRIYFSYLNTSYEVIFDKKLYNQIKQIEIEKRNKKRNKLNSDKISASKIQQIKSVYDSFINWINNPRTISGYSNLSMYDIISIYVLLDKPIQDLCNRCKKGKFDKLYDIGWASSEDYNGDYFSKSVINNVGNRSKIIERNGENDFVYNPIKNKIFYIGYEHEELISDFTDWDLLYVTDMFSEFYPDKIRQILEEYDKEKGYNFI
jgi:hypothetical protein